MADLKLADFVKETTTTTGTGTYSLAGAVTGHQGFVAAGCAGAQIPYVVTDGTNWEIGLGTVTDAATDTISRDAIYASSNAGSAVNWSAGTRDIYLAEISGHMKGVITVTGTVTLSYIHEIVLCNSASAFTVTLPPAANFPGKEYTITNINTGRVTIDGNSTEEIRDPTFGAAQTFDLWLQYDSVRIVSDGAAWWVLTKNIGKHFAHIVRAAAQSIAGTGTLAQVDFDTVVDNAGISYDLSNTSELLINRTGEYQITSNWAQAPGDTKAITLYIWDHGTTVGYLFARGAASAAGQTIYPQGVCTRPLASGVRLGMQVAQDSGGSLNTPTNVIGRPTLYVNEVW